MDKLSLQNPVFATYVIAAAIMILKAVSMSWLTVVRMMQVKGGFRSPEDIKKTLLNPGPNPKQIERNERVERIRRIQLTTMTNTAVQLPVVCFRNAAADGKAGGKPAPVGKPAHHQTDDLSMVIALGRESGRRVSCSWLGKLASLEKPPRSSSLASSAPTVEVPEGWCGQLGQGYRRTLRQ